MCRITLYSLNKDDDTHIPNLIAMNLRVHSFFLRILASAPSETVRSNPARPVKKFDEVRFV